MSLTTKFVSTSVYGEAIFIVNNYVAFDIKVRQGNFDVEITVYLHSLTPRNSLIT
jgi:hypothetical protein